MLELAKLVQFDGPGLVRVVIFNLRPENNWANLAWFDGTNRLARLKTYEMYNWKLSNLFCSIFFLTKYIYVHTHTKKRRLI